jgi:hypothetical protein
MRLPSRSTWLVCGLVLAVFCCIWLWRLDTAEPMAGFRDFPWTYITESDVGSDESRVQISRGSINGPASIVDPSTDQTAWPAFIHPDPAVVPLIDGKPCIFPLIPMGNGSRTPVLPPLRRPLTQKEIDGVQRYQTPEGRQRMDAFRKEMGL